MENTSPVAERVRQTMTDAGVSGAELARRICVSQPYLSRRLTGEVEFRTSDLDRIAAALDVPVTQLLPAAEPTAGSTR